MAPSFVYSYTVQSITCIIMLRCHWIWTLCNFVSKGLNCSVCWGVGTRLCRLVLPSDCTVLSYECYWYTILLLITRIIVNLILLLYLGQGGDVVNQTTHILLVLKLGMSGSVPPLPHMPSCRVQVRRYCILLLQRYLYQTFWNLNMKAVLFHV